MTVGNLLIAVAISSKKTRAEFKPLLEQLLAAECFLKSLGFASRTIEFADNLDLCIGRLERHYAATQDPLAIVVSDELVERRGVLAPPVQPAVASQEAKEKLDPHYLSPHGTIAITHDGERVPNIDRVLTETGVCLEQLQRSLELVAARLVYLMRPAPRSFPNPIRVRRINDELELVEYYRLRHRVYEMMGYISNQKEAVPSRMEIDGCDPTSLHLGAYEQLDGYSALAGTARVVFMNGDDSLSTVNGFRWTNHLLENDPRLKVLVQREQLPNGLPVFHSQNLNDHLHEAIRDGLHCAELSRVIVHPDYRGAQLSTRLVEHAIGEAQHNKVDRLYLECLDVHESLYAKHGFQTIPNTRGLVVGVGRNMIAMVRDTRGGTNQKPRPR